MRAGGGGADGGGRPSYCKTGGRAAGGDGAAKDGRSGCAEGAMSFAGQVAVITGASSGIGWELAKALAKEGYKVGLLARRRDLLDQLAGEVRAAGGTAAVAVADVSNRTQTVEGIHALREALGPIDLLVANAGVGAPTRLDPPNVPDIE